MKFSISHINKSEIDEYLLNNSIKLYNKNFNDFSLMCIERNYKEFMEEKTRKDEKKLNYIKYLRGFLEIKENLKSLYKVGAKNLIIDNKIDNILEQAKSSDSEIDLHALESIIVELSIDMYKEIFNKK